MGSIEIEYVEGRFRVWQWRECTEDYRVTCFGTMGDTVDFIEPLLLEMADDD